MRYSIALATVVLASALASTPVRAADMYSAMAPEVNTIEKGGWTFAVSPYFWAAGMSGDTGVFGLPPVHTNMRFEDILKELDFAAMAIGEARFERYSLFTDLMYSKISQGRGTPRGVIAESVDVTSETFAGMVGGGYSVLQSDRGNLDVVGAARLWYSKTEIGFQGGILDGIDRSDSATWVDGLAGVRGRFNITNNVYLTGWGLVGAGQADLDWDVAGGIGYKFNDKFSAVAGYRALGVDYSNDGFVMDIVQQGPILGAVFHF